MSPEPPANSNIERDIPADILIPVRATTCAGTHDVLPLSVRLKASRSSSAEAAGLGGYPRSPLSETTTDRLPI
jgi:hypothetical protein